MKKDCQSERRKGKSKRGEDGDDGEAGDGGKLLGAFCCNHNYRLDFRGKIWGTKWNRGLAVVLVGI